MYVDLLYAANIYLSMAEEVLQSFGVRVKTLRIESRISQEKLAEMAGFHRTYIGMIERGERNISLKNISLLAKALNKSMSDLLEGL